MSSLKMVNVQKQFGEFTALHDISLVIPDGEFVCFLGPSGCGKTTLMRIIAGLEQPTSGRIMVGEDEITTRPTHLRNFGMVFQSLALFPHLDVAGNIEYALKLRQVSANERQAKVREPLELVGLKEIGARRVDQLSGGQRQRIAIARALAQNPRLFLMDEPLSALDAKLREHMQVELRQLQQRLKITTIFVTHDQTEAMTITDRIVVMSNGHIQQVGTPSEIYHRPANAFVANFIGQSNIFPVHNVADNPIRTPQGILRVDVPAAMSWAETSSFCVRPENIGLSPTQAHRGDEVTGKVLFRRDLGSVIEVRLDCNGMEVIASLPPAQWNAMSGNSTFTIAARTGTFLTD